MKEFTKEEIKEILIELERASDAIYLTNMYVYNRINAAIKIIKEKSK
jgi:hypothetical protein